MENKKEGCCNKGKECCDKETWEKKAERLKEPKYFIICDEEITQVKVMRIALEHGEIKKEKIYLKNWKDAKAKIEQWKKLYD